jgi:hypothetical protein
MRKTRSAPQSRVEHQSGREPTSSRRGTGEDLLDLRHAISKVQVRMGCNGSIFVADGKEGGAGSVGDRGDPPTQLVHG